MSLLISEPAFGSGTAADDQTKIGVLGGSSVLAALLAAILLRSRNRHHRRLHEAESADDDTDGHPGRPSEVTGGSRRSPLRAAIPLSGCSCPGRRPPR